MDESSSSYIWCVFLICVEGARSTLNLLLSSFFMPVTFTSVDPSECQCSYASVHNFSSEQWGNTYNGFLSFWAHIINYRFDHSTFLLKNVSGYHFPEILKIQKCCISPDLLGYPKPFITWSKGEIVFYCFSFIWKHISFKF